MKTQIDLIREELDGVRKQLLEVAEKLGEDEFTWQPYPGMKTARDLLREIGTVEVVIVRALEGERVAFADAVRWQGEDLTSTLAQLREIREGTLQALARFPEGELLAERAHPFRPDETLYPVQAWNLLARHEYYHVGQLVTYRWLLGHNPYEEA